MTFKRPATERQLTFKEIGQITNLKEDQVEALVMKAIAKGLVNGAIDEVSRTVHMTWVQPRVLDREQVSATASIRNCVFTHKLGIRYI
jgi:26S proteasome regulatory subunit N9